MFDDVTTNAPAVNQTYICTVTRAAKTNNPEVIIFDLKVNGIDLKGMILKRVTVSKDGTKYKKGDKVLLIDFPADKANNGKWYTRFFFPISSELKDQLIAQIKSIIG